MPEETKQNRSRVERNWSTKKRQLIKPNIILASLSIVVMILVVSGVVARIVFGVDGVSQTTRQQVVKKDAKTALEFGLTGDSSTNNKQSVVNLTTKKWQAEIASSIQKALQSDQKVADSVTFSGTKYQKSSVMAALSQRYLETLQRDRAFKITTVKFDKYHNAKVTYQVKPIDLPAGQALVQKYVDEQIKKNESAASKLTQEELQLVEYAMVANNWDRVLNDKLPTSSDKIATIELLYRTKNFKPEYQITKDTLNNILNSGLAE
ncbi:GTP-binding protein [Leuconostoc falkenbergense]|uniref:GTP-binding protein n=1 Tax=Leuconostoc falkenbergense TaxID=2766470 RepID=UPI0028B06BED|nr:GTP-binding protein [Leuconostoc falkenbergense]